MMTAAQQVHAFQVKRSVRTVAVVSNHPYLHALERVLDGMDHDIVFVEAISRAYSQIKREMPDLIVLCLSDDDAASCQVLSMLRLDRETARIPVLTYASSTFDSADERSVEEAEEMFSRFVPVSMN